MINNKQVNIWRGTDTPPTIYHVWLYNDSELRIYNGEIWETFINDKATLDKITDLFNEIENIKSEIAIFLNSTIKGKLISSNPILTGNDLLLNRSGTYLEQTQSLSSSLISLDTLLSTQIIE